MQGVTLLLLAVAILMFSKGVAARRPDSFSQSVESSEQRYGGPGNPGGGRFPRSGNQGGSQNGRPGQNSGGFPGQESEFNNQDFPAGGNRPNGGRPQGPNQGEFPQGGNARRPQRPNQEGFPRGGNGPNNEDGFLQGPGSGGYPAMENRPNNNGQRFLF